jgi:2-polyprenyl-6-hydroxyphenyl methylase/3-demethylubiquinone-9 3-methyltransferase
MNDIRQYEINANEWWKKDGRFHLLSFLNKPRFQYFDRIVSNWKNKSVLDVGCGGGYSCEYMTDREMQISGIDISPSSITVAKNHALANNLTIDYRTADACQLPFPDASFDFVLCVDVLEHINDPALAIKEISRVLKPKGYFLFDTINRNFFTKLFFIWLAQNLLRIIPKDTHDWGMFIKVSEMRSYLDRAGLNLLDTKGLCPIGISLKNLTPIFCPLNLTFAFYLGVAQKE